MDKRERLAQMAFSTIAFFCPPVTTTKGEGFFDMCLCLGVRHKKMHRESKHKKRCNANLLMLILCEIVTENLTIAWWISCKYISQTRKFVEFII